MVLLGLSAAATAAPFFRSDPYPSALTPKPTHCGIYLDSGAMAMAEMEPLGFSGCISGNGWCDSGSEHSHPARAKIALLQRGDVARDIVPSTLNNGDVHLNSAGYVAAANRVAEFINQKGWIQ